MNAAKLYLKHSQEELLKMASEVENDPKSLNTAGSLYKFTPAARAKLDKIALAITFHLADKREASGNPVPCDGYSGRNSKKR